MEDSAHPARRGDPTQMHKLRTLRRSHAWTQADLARESRVSKVTISRLESGKTPSTEVYASTVKKLADALGVEPKVLVNCGPPAAGEG